MTVNQICSKNNTKDTTGGAGTLIVWGFIFYVCCLYLVMPISIQWYLYITWRSCKLRFYFSGIGDFSRLSLILYRFFGFIAPENIKLVGFPFFSEAEEGFYRNSSSALNLTSTILLLVAQLQFVLPSFPHSWLATGSLKWVTRLAPPVEQELQLLLWTWGNPLSSGNHIARSFVLFFCVVFCQSWLVHFNLLLATPPLNICCISDVVFSFNFQVWRYNDPDSKYLFY